MPRISSASEPLLLRRLAASLVVVLAVLSAAALSGCGGADQKFNHREADRGLAALDSIEASLQDGNCSSARSQANSLVKQASSIQRRRADLGNAYATSAQRLQQLVAAECNQAPVEPTAPVTGETGATAEPTTPAGPTEQTQKQPKPKQTDPGGTQLPPTEPTAPDGNPGNGQGDNQGNGQGNGGGNGHDGEDLSGGVAPQ